MNSVQILSLLVLTSAAAMGGDTGSWEAVTQAPRGATVEVIHAQVKRATGTLVDATEEGITIETTTGISLVARREVRRVSLVRKSRKKRALLGAVLGAAAGAAALALGASAGNIDIQRGLVTGAGAALGAGIGGAFGAMTGGSETIYRARYAEEYVVTEDPVNLEKRPTAVLAISSDTARDVESILNGLGWQAQVAGGIHEAAGLVASYPSVAAVFTEVALHDGNWRDLIEQVKVRRPGLPVFLCAPAGTAELWWDALECGVLDIITPPYSRMVLEQTLARLGV